MSEKKRLELNFQDEANRNRRLTINRPEDGLTEELIKPAMEKLSGSTIFNENGLNPYANIVGARYVQTNVTEVF